MFSNFFICFIHLLIRLTEMKSDRAIQIYMYLEFNKKQEYDNDTTSCDMNLLVL